MKDTDFRKQNAKEIGEYELSQDEFQKLIEEKFKRAYAYRVAFGKREDEVVDYNWSQKCL